MLLLPRVEIIAVASHFVREVQEDLLCLMLIIVLEGSHEGGMMEHCALTRAQSLKSLDGLVVPEIIRQGWSHNLDAGKVRQQLCLDALVLEVLGIIQRLVDGECINDKVTFLGIGVFHPDAFSIKDKHPFVGLGAIKVEENILIGHTKRKQRKVRKEKEK